MRTSSAPRSTPARLGRRLLLALALCACGDSDRGGGSSRAPAGGDTASTQSAAAATCPAPPTIDDPTLLTGEWSALISYLTKQGASFPDVTGNRDTADVALCDSCTAVPLVIRSDTTTYCTTPDSLQTGRLRVMGLFVLAGDFPGGPGGWPPLKQKDSLLVFASDTAGRATLVYRSGTRATIAPPGSWQFYYCKDNPQRPIRAQAQWRPRAPRAGGPETGDEGGTYGWLACASGCCQFYTPAPPADDDKGRDPGQGGGRGRPSWCTGNHPAPAP